MQEPKITRPKLPPGYVDHPTSEVAWTEVEERLRSAINYWLCSVRPDGRPHVIPRWGVWVQNAFYYDGSPETRHAKNIQGNPAVALHLESGEQAIILEGRSAPVGRPAFELAQQVAAAYRLKYASAGYAPEANQWDSGGLYVFRPRQALAWTVFFENPTKFIFPSLD